MAHVYICVWRGLQVDKPLCTHATYVQAGKLGGMEGSGLEFQFAPRLPILSVGLSSCLSVCLLWGRRCGAVP